MFRLRLIFILSLIVLAGLFVSIVYFLPSREGYTETKRVHIIEAEDEWILQYDIINNEERDIEYTIVVTIDDIIYTDSTVVKPGKSYTYIHHIYPQQLQEGKVSFASYQEGKPEPIEQATFHLAHN
ncbi:MAG: hypothetical protein MUO99_02515 [Dehalococcoidales bacterium]|nr:hypothetical protein [Dehalococcoidales bacterium]